MNTSKVSKENEKGIALITGGAGGIGAACCKELANAGFKVAIHYRSNDTNAKELLNEIPKSFLVKADLSTTEGVDHVYDILKEKGGIEVLVNNAGMTADAPLLRGKLDDFDKVVSLNMKSTWYITKKMSRMMARKSKGRIINISSVVGSTGNPGQSVYGMTKAAINNFTQTCAMELAPYNILVNSVAPGFIETPMTEILPEEEKDKIKDRIPLQRLGRPSDIAKMVKFLATEGDYCTGSVFHVNGGMYGGQ